MKAKATKAPLVIPRSWQITFVVIFIVFWLTVYVYVGLSFLYHPGYTSLVTNLIEISYAFYPAVYFLLAFFLLPNPKDHLRRWFLAIFVALLGMLSWLTLSTIINRLAPRLMYWNEKGTNVWDTFGGEWLQMIIAGLAFIAVLVILRRKSEWLRG